MNHDDTTNASDELTEEELAGVTGGRRISPAAVSASKLQVSARATAATSAKALSPSAVAAVKGLTRKTSSTDLSGTISPVKGTVGLDD